MPSAQKIAGDELGCSSCIEEGSRKGKCQGKYPHCIKGVIVSGINGRVYDFILTKDYRDNGNYNRQGTIVSKLYYLDDNKKTQYMHDIDSSFLFDRLRDIEAGQAYISNELTFIVGLNLDDTEQALKIHNDLEKKMKKNAKNKQDEIDYCIKDFKSAVSKHKMKREEYFSRGEKFTSWPPQISNRNFKDCRKILEDAEKKGLLKGYLGGGRRASKTKRARHSKKRRTRRN